MKKFVTLFLLLVISFSTIAQTSTYSTTQTAAETSTIELQPIQLEMPKVQPITEVRVETFAINIEDEVATPEPLPVPSASELRCLQRNIYFEARAEGERGMAAVAQVTVNRTKAKGFPNTVCGVVHEQKVKGFCQFTWFCDARLRAGPKLIHDAEKEAWDLAGKVALMALDGTLRNVVGNATHYHNTSCHPNWRGLAFVARIGHHIFYRED